MRPRGKFLSVAALLPTLLAAQGTAQRPNIMIIMLDDMGYSDPQCFGGEVETPNLNRMAQEGMRFTQFFNSGRSCPSRANMMTGIYAQQSGITGMGLSLNRQCVTLPEVLKSAGYNTAMSGKWHLSLTRAINGKNGSQEQLQWLSHQNYFNNAPFSPLDTYPCNRGFDEHWGTIWGVCDHFDPFSLVHNEEPIFVDSIPRDFYSTDFVTEKANEMLDELTKKDEPFFLYVAYNAPHWPLHAKPQDIAKYKGRYDEGWDVLRQRRYKKMVELGLVDPKETPEAENASGRAWEKESDKALQAANMEVHAAMVDCVDQGIGRIIAKLKETGAYDNTIIIFSSDNGASSENYNIGDFDRHNMTRDGRQVVHNSPTPGDELSYNYLGTGWAGAVNTPFRYWKRESYHGGIAAPTIVLWPQGMKPELKGTISREPCQYIDFMPTFLEAAGATYPTTFQGNSIIPLAPEGQSFLPLLTGEGEWKGERTLFWEHETGKAVRVGDWKLTALCGGGWQLFNLKNDYSETTNLAAEYPEKVRQLKALWNEWAKRVGLEVPEELPDTPKELLFYFPFDGQLIDKSANGFVLSPSYTGKSFAKGRYGQSVQLNGDGQYLDLDVTGLLDARTTLFTVCAWVYDETGGAPTIGREEDGHYFRDQIILAQKDHAGTGRIALYSRVEKPVDGADVRCTYSNFLGGRRNTSTAGAAVRGRWQHVAVVCDPKERTVTYYVDGKRDCTVSTPAFESCQGGFRIGSHKNGGNSWHGRIDELYFFRGLLTPAEICQVRDNTYLHDGRR